MPSAETRRELQRQRLHLGCTRVASTKRLLTCALRHVTPVAAVTPIFFIPVFGVTWSFLFLDEPVSIGTFVGGAIVLLAAALVTGFNPLRRRAISAIPPP